ncbi:EAL domain-containing protein [Paenibacillus sp. GCM10027626]|uniref:EAL domain-containing protein n=1 Tax=Paenibacillus sp. GCM10027626 TaxID=3273411 RepID=UPI003626E31B
MTPEPKPSYVTQSHELCKKYNLEPDVMPMYNQLSAEELQAKVVEYEEVLKVTQYFMDKLLESLPEQYPLLVAVCDHEATILQIAGEKSMVSMLDEVGFRVGGGVSEKLSGTNVVTLSLRLQSPIQLIGDDHFHTIFHGSSCYAVPIKYQDEKTIIGSIAVMTAAELHNPLFITMLQTTADSIERELTLRRQNKRLHILNQIIMETKKNAAIMIDNEGFITELNRPAAATFLCERPELLGKSVFRLPYLGPYFQEVLHAGKHYEDIEISLDRYHLVVVFDASPIVDRGGKIIGAFGQFRDITERYEAEAKVNYMAYHDELTTLPNRRMFIQVAKNELKREERGESEQLAVVFLDMDRFKIVNDSLGHSEGDQLLMQVSDRLKRCVQGQDLVARMGGDEFMFLFKGVSSREQVKQRVSYILRSFEKPFTVGGSEFYMSSSLGVALYPEHGRDIETLMIHADSAMYQAKSGGKNRFTFFEPDMRKVTNEQLELEKAIRKALDRGEFSLHYQPQIQIGTGKLTGIEALVRWHHPTMGDIAPSRFIPVAEDTGLILPIGEWVLREACRQNKTWQDAGYPPVRISINLSAAQFAQSHLIDSIKKVLAETKLEAKYLEVEITESMTMDVAATVEALHGLRALGVQIAMDDFGTGYSSFNHLKRFGLHRLKIDKSFISDIDSGSHDADIVGSIIAMAHQLGLLVIAEGVETAEQLAFLEERQCDEVQGYYFSKPLPPEEMVRLF